MSMTFTEENHLYESLPSDPNQLDWVSGTGLVGFFKQPFDPQQPEKSSKRKPTATRPNRWYGVHPDEIRRLWAQNSKNSTDRGSWYHAREEKQMIQAGQLERGGRMIPVIAPLFCQTTGKKLAPAQKLAEGIYPEHFVYMKSLGLCGQADIAERVINLVNIGDYKTNAKLDRESYKDWEGQSKKMLHVLGHLDDCNWNHYCLQLSLYMYMILKHNPSLKPGKLTIYHIKFVPELDAEGKPRLDQWEWPVYAQDADGNPIVESVTPLDVPYLKKEVESMLQWLTANRHKLPTKH